LSASTSGPYKGFHGDNAHTFAVGEISQEAGALLDATEESLYKAIEAAQAGGRLGDLSHAVQSHVEGYGYNVVRSYVGHGIGQKMHESPEVPNFGKAGRGPRLTAGMTLAIEPMVNAGGYEVTTLGNGTVLTKDGSLSAHFEHTVLITDNGPVILTQP
jgi:methionyl aminopeptidase